MAQIGTVAEHDELRIATIGSWKINDFRDAWRGALSAIEE